MPQFAAPAMRLFPNVPSELDTLLREHVALYAMLEKDMFTDAPFAAVTPFVLKLASLLEIVIWAVAASAFMPSEVAFSVVE